MRRSSKSEDDVRPSVGRIPLFCPGSRRDSARRTPSFPTADCRRRATGDSAPVVDNCLAWNSQKLPLRTWYMSSIVRSPSYGSRPVMHCRIVTPNENMSDAKEKVRSGEGSTISGDK